MRKKLIFDIGFHVGQDTEYYLKKGYWVVAVDANPELVEQGRHKFSEWIARGRLVLLNVGVGEYGGSFPFYLNEENSAFSSFDRKIGTSRGKFREIQVPLVPLADLTAKYGVPYYIKLDIEGLDSAAIRSLRNELELPRYVSIENGQRRMIEELVELGYSSFKWVNQANVPEVVLPHPALEGDFCEHKFVHGSSGPFGDEIAGDWLSVQQVLLLSDAYWGRPDRDANIHGWFDLHASRDLR